ncbi:MAG: adenine/guanine/hypoxanthine permease [Frankiales bacterium]|jgi:AGZA family xanthine/uracil permease-like MFS transporter|nr:adenine/guanine/hypoxanthine permease [Frankiales bacterium]
MTGTSVQTGRGLDGFFQISRRGSTIEREVRGGLATFFTMAYIIVLNPIILSLGKDKFGHALSFPELAAATALIAGIMTLIMGVGGNVPIALAAGLGLNGVLAFQIAPTMSWPDAMGLVVIEGLLICVLVATGLRQMIMDAIPLPLKQAISVGIGLFIAFIGLVDAGFVHTPQGGATPVGLGVTGGGRLTGWPVVVFAFGLLLTVVLLTRRVRGAILISIVSSTLLALFIHAVANDPDKQWGLQVPKWPKDVTATPDLSLIGNFSIHGGFVHAGIITALVFIFTLALSDFFDTMGTVIGIGNEAGLLDEKGQLPNIGRVLFIDAAAAAAGGAASVSSNTSYIESAAGVGEGARTGLSNVVVAALFGLALFFTPIYAIVPQAAATPALVAVGFLLMTQAKDIPWDDYAIAIPAFLTMILMPFTYSITNGIGAGFISYVVIRAAQGRHREPSLLLWATSLLFAAYFCLDPIERALGVK